VAPRSHWGLTPRQSIEAECARRGRPAVIAGCRRLIQGDDADPALIIALGGPYAPRLLDGDPQSDQRYWFRVWGTRGLLWAWDDSALDAVFLALSDPAWRVRELAAKVAARHGLGDVLPALVDLRDDQVPRVRAAASRAIALLTQAGA
jgi:HEAT repeats